MINSKARNNFNNRASNLVKNLIIESDVELYNQNYMGSDAEIYANDWSNKSPLNIDGISRNINVYTRECSDIFLTKNQERIGFEKNNYLEFIKLIRSIHKIAEINIRTTQSFLESLLLHWSISVYENSRITTEFCDFIEEKLNEVCGTWTVAFKVLYLRIPCKIQIGETWFDYTRKEEIETFIINKDILEPKEAIDIRNLYGNTVYVACKIENSTRERAIELGYTKCTLSIDILKCFSPTVRMPKILTHFDIDSRTNKNEKNLSFVFKNSFFEHLTVNIKPSSGENFIFPMEFIPFLHNHIFQTLIDSKIDTNELKEVVKMNIKKFASAISNDNYFDRIVILASIWDSIFISSESDPVISTITRYGPKLASSKIEERKKIRRIITSMYKCRSAYLHRAVESKYNESDLADFQYYTLEILNSLAFLSFYYREIKEIIELIDDDLEAAFKIENYVSEIKKR